MSTSSTPIERSAGYPLPPLLRGLGLLVGAQLLLYTLLRLVFYFSFRASAVGVPRSDILEAFWLGLRFDLRLALLLALPLYVLYLLPPLRPGRPFGAWLWRAGATGVGLLLTLVYFFDLGHYDYLHERLDAKVLDELRSPREAAGMIWESYPVVWGLLLVVLVGLGWRALGARAARTAAQPTNLSRRRRVLVGTLCTLAGAWGIYGNFSWYPLRWSQAHFSTEPFVSALAMNPALQFVETLSHPSRTPDRERVVRDYDLLCDLLEVERRDPEQLLFARRFQPDEPLDFAPNLVVIHLESWASFQTGAMGNPLDASPHFDALTADSLLFTDFFVPTGPTARSVYSMLTGIPDVPANNPGGSASRHPEAVRQPVLASALKGYDKHYFLGGSANWANIRAVLSGNIDGIRIHEEGSYEGEREDVWGVSDLDLFEAAAETLDASPGPFFAFIQTSGNHKPYTIPTRTGGFELAEVADETLQAAGFKSLEAYNGFRFLDHALGRFFELARERPWYANTVFALYGDHGVPAVNGIPFERMGLVRHHVPLVLHAPRLILEPGRIEFPASSVDILPTCLSLMRVGYVNTALGRDLLTPRPPERRFAFMTNGLAQDEWFLRQLKGGGTALYRYSGPEPDVDWSAREPERVQQMSHAYGALLNWALWTQQDSERRLRLERELE